MRSFIKSNCSPASYCIRKNKQGKRAASREEKEAFLSTYKEGKKKSLIRRMLGLWLHLTKPKPKHKMKRFFGFFSRLFGSNPKKRGRTVALTALLAFNAPQDALKFAEIKSELVSFLRTGMKLDKYMIIRFSNQAAEKLNVNPLAFRVLVASLVDQMESENGDTNARLFIEGVVEALDMLGA